MAHFTQMFGEYSAKMRLGHARCSWICKNSSPRIRKKKRGLPVDERLANTAPDPVIDAEVEQRRERPDGLALARDVAQHAGAGAGENVHRQCQPLAPEKRGKRNQDAGRRSHQAPADNAREDGAHECNIGGVEIVDPVPRQHAQRDGRSHDEDDLHFLAEGALFAEEQHAESPRANQYTADRRRNAQADQQGHENEFLVHGKQLSVVGCQLPV